MTRRDRSLRAHATPTARARRLRDPDRWDETAAWEPAWRPARRRRSIGRTIMTLLLLAIVALLAGGVLVAIRVAAFNDRVSTAPALSSATLLPLNGAERLNVLLIGYGGGRHEGGYLADSINIISIDPTADASTTIPIPRDFWIEGLAALPENGKVNEAFALATDQGGIQAGAALLAELLSGATGLQIEHWMAIDFAGFREMVDAVGGVTITNPVPFSYTTNEQLHASGVWNDGSFPAGEISLNGEQALAYARARYTDAPAESSDFARSIRQQRILSAMKAKLGDGGLASVLPGLRMMDALEDRLTTDLSAIDLFLLSGHISSERRIELAEGPVLTATTNTDGQYILIPSGWTGPGDYGGLHAFLEAALAEPIPSPSPTASIGAQ